MFGMAQKYVFTKDISRENEITRQFGTINCTYLDHCSFHSQKSGGLFVFRALPENEQLSSFLRAKRAILFLAQLGFQVATIDFLVRGGVAAQSR
jgi:hypothetical protein